MDEMILAKQIADRLLENSDSCRRRHFSVIDEYRPVPFPIHWRRKNVGGVTFRRDEPAAARAWIIQALLAGYSVFHQRTKNSCGAGSGIEHEREWKERQKSIHIQTNPLSQNEK